MQYLGATTKDFPKLATVKLATLNTLQSRPGYHVTIAHWYKQKFWCKPSNLSQKLEGSFRATNLGPTYLPVIGSHE